MLRFHELQQNPVSVACRDENGATYTVVAMRLREGIVKMTCQCQRYSQEGWCRHCLAVFSNCEVFESKKHRKAFEQLVGRTYLEHAATKLTIALDDFAGAYRKMKAVRPSDVDRGQLKKFAEQAYRASASADELAVALEKFIKEAEARGRGGDEKGLSRKPRLVTRPQLGVAMAAANTQPYHALGARPIERHHLVMHSGDRLIEEPIAIERRLRKRRSVDPSP